MRAPQAMAVIRIRMPNSFPDDSPPASSEQGQTGNLPRTRYGATIARCPELATCSLEPHELPVQRVVLIGGLERVEPLQSLPDVLSLTLQGELLEPQKHLVHVLGGHLADRGDRLDGQGGKQLADLLTPAPVLGHLDQSGGSCSSPRSEKIETRAVPRCGEMLGGQLGQPRARQLRGLDQELQGLPFDGMRRGDTRWHLAPLLIWPIPGLV